MIKIQVQQLLENKLKLCLITVGAVVIMKHKLSKQTLLWRVAALGAITLSSRDATTASADK